MRLIKSPAAIILAGVLFLAACSAPVITRTSGASPVMEPERTLSRLLESERMAKPASFRTSDMTTSTAECNTGGDMWVNVTVTNTGGQPGTYPVVLKVNGVDSRTENVTLAAGASQDVHFVLTQKDDLPEFTTYKLTIDTLEKDVGVI